MWQVTLDVEYQERTGARRWWCWYSGDTVLDSYQDVTCPSEREALEEAARRNCWRVVCPKTVRS